MTPEDFLTLHNTLADVVEAMQPVYQLVATVRRGFMEEGGVGAEAADLLTVEWCRTMMFPLIAPNAVEASA